MEQGVPLRENWALPFFSCQVAALTGFLSRSTGSASEVGSGHCGLEPQRGSDPCFPTDVLLPDTERLQLQLPAAVGTRTLLPVRPGRLPGSAGLTGPGTATQGKDWTGSLPGSGLQVILNNCGSDGSGSTRPVSHQTADVYRAYLGSLVLVYLAQFQNASLLGSPLLSLLIGLVPARYFQVELAPPPTALVIGCFDVD